MKEFNSEKLITLLVCTLGKREYEFDRLISSLQAQVYSNFQLVVVSQDNHEKVELQLKTSNLNYKHIISKKKGLSAGRNIALQYAYGDIITISDDDCWYPKDAFLNVLKLMDESLKPIIVGQIFDPNNDRYYKHYGLKRRGLSKFEIGKVSSIEIFFRKEVVTEGIKFDEDFGLGTKVNSGEEYVFLADALKQGFEVQYIPSVFVYHKVRQRNKVSFSMRNVRMKFFVYRRVHGSFLSIFFVIRLVIKNYVKNLFLKKFNDNT